MVQSLTYTRINRIGGHKITTIKRIEDDVKPDAIELDLFESQPTKKIKAKSAEDERWYSETREIAYTFGSRAFYASELRMKCGKPPRDPNMWGIFFRSLVISGEFLQTGQYRKSPVKLRRGGVDFQYQKKAKGI